jgi:protein involved in polysaccharide export with SLBB domain
MIKPSKPSFDRPPRVAVPLGRRVLAAGLAVLICMPPAWAQEAASGGGFGGGISGGIGGSTGFNLGGGASAAGGSASLMGSSAAGSPGAMGASSTSTPGAASQPGAVPGAPAAGATPGDAPVGDASVFRQRNSDGNRHPQSPLEPNDFQRFVQAGTGRLLPMFGANLFQSAPSTFAPSESVPVPGEYVIGPGDELIIRSSGMLELELRPTVDRDGQIVIPKVGTVQVAGVRRADLERYLTQQVSRSFRNFTLSATLGQLRSIDIYVVGQARRPGKYTVSSLSTLVNALFASGGPNANGSMRRVRLVRSDRSAVSIDLYDFIVKGDKSKDVKLLPGDVIVFPPAGPRIAVSGAVNTPAVYELISNDTPIREVLALSGGLPILASPLKAQLERVDPTRAAARTVLDFSLDENGLGQRLRDADLLTVFPISPQFANAVTLRGNVAAPLRYPFKPGMRVRDLIPEREALITRDYFVRKNMLVQFEDSGQQVSAERARRDVRTMLDEVNWEYAVIERLDEGQLKTRLIPFNLGAVVLRNDESQNQELRVGDVVTIFSNRDLRVPQARQTRLVRVEGEVTSPGIYEVVPGETLPQLIARVGGTTPEAYLYGVELQRVSVRDQQAQNLQSVARRLEEQITAGIATRQANLTIVDASQLAMQQQRIQTEERLARERLERMRKMQPSGRIALELNPEAPELPPLALEDGDRVLVPPRPSFVGIAGAVYNENVLVWRPHRTVADYMQSAGPTESADIDNTFVLRADGSVATRPESGTLFGMNRSTLHKTVLAPGDTIVVPEKIDRETVYTGFMRGLKDWTQVIYQLGLGAAAVKVLRN